MLPTHSDGSEGHEHQHGDSGRQARTPGHGNGSVYPFSHRRQHRGRHVQGRGEINRLFGVCFGDILVKHTAWWTNRKRTGISGGKGRERCRFTPTSSKYCIIKRQSTRDGPANRVHQIGDYRGKQNLGLRGYPRKDGTARVQGG